MKRVVLVTVLSALVGLFGACDSMSKMAPGAGERKLLSEKLQQLSADLDLANVKIESLESRLVALEVQARMELGQYKSAVLDPGERGFSRLDTSLGSFVVSLQDVTPYADGVRVRLNVGNLTTAMVKGGTFRVKWGPRKPPLRGEDYALRYSEWTKALREKSIEFQDDLRSGAWNSVTLSLVGLPPAQFGYLELSMETPTISLLQPR